MPDLVLVGCVKSKLPGRRRARDLYTSTLFAGRRSRAEESGAPWFVISAKYGLTHPDEQIDTYDLTLSQLPTNDRRAWAERVLEQIDRQIGSVRAKTIEIHAGEEYRQHGLVQGLRARGANVVVPLQGMPIGRQLEWYAGRAAQSKSTKCARSESRCRTMD